MDKELNNKLWEKWQVQFDKFNEVNNVVLIRPMGVESHCDDTVLLKVA